MIEVGQLPHPLTAAAQSASIAPISGNRKLRAACSPVALSQRYTASGPLAKTAAKPCESDSGHWFVKLSWQLAHLRLVPRNTWAVVWAACSSAPLAGVDDAPPLDSLHESFGAVHRADQLVDEAVVGPIFVQGTKQPAGDLPTAVVDKSGPAIFVAQQVVPEGEPVDGIILAACEKLSDERSSLVGPRITDEHLELGRRGRQADQVEKTRRAKTRSDTTWVRSTFCAECAASSRSTGFVSLEPGGTAGSWTGVNSTLGSPVLPRSDVFRAVDWLGRPPRFVLEENESVRRRRP